MVKHALRAVPPAYFMVIAIFIVGALGIDGYTSLFSIRALLVLSAFLIIASAGQTMTMLIGGIDLSIPFVVGFANVAVAQLGADGVPFWLAVIIVMLISIALGALNGAISAILKVHPLIITLGTGTALLGAVLLWTRGYPSGSAPDYISNFVSIGASIGPVPVPWLVPATLVLVVLLLLFETQTALGRQVFALGSNPTAAPYVLIKPLRIWMFCFGLSAALAALTGILLLGFSGAAFADAGRPYLFQTVAAAVIGGTALSGGKGGILGTVAGALALTQLNTVLIGFGLDQSAVQAALGALIVLVVALYGRQAHLRNSI
ncbi:ABC transporter permease [Hoeflea sp.]|uniref:ABC transporter permease n=1 Tax=Hoeflea sp. TaxID=1940281 RepID=UPI003BB01584